MSSPTPVAVPAPFLGTLVSLAVGVGDEVHAGQPVAVMEAMKMEHIIEAPVSGIVRSVSSRIGEAVDEGELLVAIAEAEIAAPAGAVTVAEGAGAIRADLAEVLDRHAALEDDRRPEAVAKRRGTRQRTARENLADLCELETFVEYGALAIAAQQRRRSIDELIDRTSNDSIITGVATVNGHLFGPEDASCALMIYDYTVLAGTQGYRGHLKMDRLLRLAHERRLPLIMYAEGGGGRPGDVDVPHLAGLDVPAFNLTARLSGSVPVVGVVSGYCFAGNAVQVACADVIIATEDSNIGAGGPAMIEGGGLGTYHPREVGPIDDMWTSGVVDIRVADEAEATAAAKKYLGYFQGPLADWTGPDQQRLRDFVPENRVQVYDVRRVVEGLADTGSVLELRAGFGHGMVTALARIEGRPLGLLANNPAHLGGAIDRDGADKAARFLQLCDAFGLPVVVLCDTPGIMVGPDSEREATVRHAARLFVISANLSVPVGTIVLRKGYGLGAQAMAAAGFKETDFTISWPTGEFGGMNLEGAVHLGYRRELEEIDDLDQRQARYDELLAQMYERGRALPMAMTFELDAVIDPADSRRWVMTMLRNAPAPSWRHRDTRPNVDTW